jgi:SH3-like domain-containing protein
MQRNLYHFQIFSLFLAIFCSFLVFSAQAQAQAQAQESPSAFSVTGLPIPRFVTLASERVFMRAGPGQKYPVLWEYSRRGLPVEIVMEFDVWRKIRDSEGAEGWVHKSLLSGRRAGIVKHDDLVSVFRRPETTARLMAYAQPEAIISLETCANGWCQVRAQGYSGWMERKFIWGVYEAEEFN